MPSHCRARDGGLGHLQPAFSELASRPPSESFLSLSGQSPGGLIPCWISFQHVVTDHLYQARHHAALCLHTGILGYVPRTQLGSANITGDNTIRLFLFQSPGRNLVGLGAEEQAVVGRVFGSIWPLPCSIRLLFGNLSSVSITSYPSTCCSGIPEPQAGFLWSNPHSVLHNPSIICTVG